MPVRSLLRICVWGIAALMIASTARADNWERFRGPNGEGVANGQDLPLNFSMTQNVRWKITIPGLGHSSPVVWGDRIFLQTAGADASYRALLCIDAKSGTIIWDRRLPAAKANHTLRFDSSLASATPTTDGEAVYIPFWDGGNIIMAAYSIKGDKLWNRNLGPFFSQHGAGASPILYKDKLIFPMDMDGTFQKTNAPVPIDHPARLYALNKKTGEITWEIPRVAYRTCYSVPSILEKPGAPPELLVTSTTAINSYDPDSGKVIWEWKWAFPKGDLRTIASTIYHDGLLMASSGDGDGRRYMVAVAMNGRGKEARPSKIWDNKKEFPYVPCMLSHKDYIYFVNDAGFAGCYEAKTGKSLWYERLPGAGFYASPLLIDGKIYAASQQGDVYVLAAEPKFRILAKNPLGDEVVRATPAVANGCLYVRTQDHLYCIANKK